MWQGLYTEEFTDMDWNVNEPNNHRGTESCVEIWHKSYGRWNDQTCSDRLPFVCEIPVQKSRFV